MTTVDVHTKAGLEAFLGPWVVGIALTEVMAGIVCCQAVNYFNSYPKDKLFLKLTVLTVVVITIVTAVLDMVILWNYTVTDFGNYKAIKSAQIPHLVNILLTGIIASISQGYFAWRSWRFANRNIWLLVLMILLICVGFTGAWGTAISQLLTFDFAWAKLKNHEWAVQMWLWGSAACDIVISAILVLKLTGERSKSMKRTQLVLGQVINTIMTTALFTSTWAMLDAVIFTANYTQSNAHIAFVVCVPRAYAMSFLYTLNVRKEIRHNMELPPGSVSILPQFTDTSSSQKPPNSVGSDSTKVSSTLRKSNSVMRKKPILDSFNDHSSEVELEIKREVIRSDSASFMDESRT